MVVATADPIKPAFLDRGGAARLAVVKHVHRPSKTLGPGVVYLPGIGSSKDGTKALALERMVEQRLRSGFIRFDYSGHGESFPGPEQFAETHPGVWLEDARAVLDKLTDRPQILVGSSYGALLALHLAAERPAQVAGLVLASPALELDSRAWALLTAAQQRALLGGSAATIESGLIDCDTEVQGPSAVKIHFFREGRRLALPTKPGSVQAACPVRILHGSRDKVVPLESSLRLVRQLASDDVTMTVLKDAEHRLHRPRELEALAAAVLHLWGQLARRSG